MTYKYYLVTIKSRGTVYTTPQELYSVYDKLKSSMKMTEWSDLRVLERTKSDRLHFHSIVVTQENIFRLCKIHNTNRIYINFTLFPGSDYPNVRDYLLKQVPDRNKQNEIIAENFFDNENAFNSLDEFYKYNLPYIISQYNRHPIHV